jgi:hypothetical protein
MQIMNNPQAFLSKMIPSEHMASPQDAVKYLLDNGRVTQTQVEQAKGMYQQYFGNKRTF